MGEAGSTEPFRDVVWNASAQVWSRDQRVWASNTDFGRACHEKRVDGPAPLSWSDSESWEEDLISLWYGPHAGKEKAHI